MGLLTLWVQGFALSPTLTSGWLQIGALPTQLEATPGLDTPSKAARKSLQYRDAQYWRRGWVVVPSAAEQVSCSGGVGSMRTPAPGGV